MDVAAGAAYSGRRALVTTKQVGMNVLSDSLFYTAYTGAEAAIVVVTADDPGMFSSQNEQDNRHYAKLGKIPMLEPADSQEGKDFRGGGRDQRTLRHAGHRPHHHAHIAFQGVVELGPAPEFKGKVGPFTRDMKKYNCMCAWSRERHPVVEQRLLDLAQFAETFPLNRIEWGARDLGIITSGVVYEYARQVFPEASFLKLGMVYPLPGNLIREFAHGVKTLLVVEELDPFLEEQIKAMGISARGKDVFPACGELLPEDIQRHCRLQGFCRRPGKASRRPPPRICPRAARCCARAARTGPPSTS